MSIAVGNPAKVNGRLKVRKAMGKVSADEPADSLQAPSNKTPQSNDVRPLDNQVQGGKYNPGNTDLQSPRNVKSPQPSNQSVNAKPGGGLKAALAGKLYGKKKLTK